MNYTSINKPYIKELNQLKRKKYRDQTDLFLVEGKHLVTEAYNSGCLKELLVEENIDYKIDVNTHIINKSIVKYLSELDNPTGIFGVCKKINHQNKNERLLILDGVQDPGNMGTIIRSAKAFDIDKIIINDKCVDPYNSKVIRATQGMIFKVDIEIKELNEYIKEIKHTHKIYVTKVDGGKSLKKIEKENKFAIIMGSEGQGVSEELQKQADTFLYIPMNEECESLNVAVATSIILYEFGGLKI